MSTESPYSRYIVEPDEKFHLADRDPHEKFLFDDLNKEDSRPLLDTLRADIRSLQQQLYAESKHRVLVVFQAMDTGGKDGCVRNVFSTVDPQGIVVTPFKKPSDEELAHDFLWRIHQHAPANGQIAVFNRSHYEDIIAVRVKKIYGKDIWKPRYQHIIDFEKMLADEGTLILKFFLNISKDEQKERLQARLDDPAKHWKFNPDDLADRAKWDEFQEVYEDVICKTSTPHAPWFVIPSDRKWHRNLCVASIFREALEGLEMRFPEPTWKPEEISIS